MRLAEVGHAVEARLPGGVHLGDEQTILTLVGPESLGRDEVAGERGRAGVAGAGAAGGEQEGGAGEDEGRGSLRRPPRGAGRR